MKRHKREIQFNVGNANALESVTYGDLLARFYRLNRIKHLKPKAVVYNPEQLNLPIYDDDTWLFFYYGDFYIQVKASQTNEIFGPHPTFLCFSPNGKLAECWCGTAQAEATFFSKKAMLKEIRNLIRNKEFFISPDDRDRVIDFTTKQNEAEQI